MKKKHKKAVNSKRAGTVRTPIVFKQCMEQSVKDLVGVSAHIAHEINEAMKHESEETLR